MINNSFNLKKPLISVIVPVYNRAQSIQKALESVVAQTYTSWEAIVVDDGSTDDTCAIVSKIAKNDKRVRLVKHNENRKAQVARNTGIRSAKGDWITFLDSDDTYLPDSLELRINNALKANVQVVHSECYILKPDRAQELYRIRPLSGNVYKKVLEKEGPVFPALLVTKLALEHIGLLDEQIKSYQEWDTSIRLAKHFEFGFVVQPTFIYDYRCDDSMSRNSIQNGQGYEQIVFKHIFAIWKQLGMRGLAFHFDKASQWYKEGYSKFNSLRCSFMSGICKCLSISIIYNKIRLILHKKAYQQ